MTGAERRQQLLEIGRTLFAAKGFEGTSVEEIAAKAGVSKPVVYEHFGARRGCTPWWWTARCGACWTW
jgi:AcrR family transcriptional regulator